jgi:mannose-6-phosphate isomerase-like protein (cupin superfamily)
VIRGSSDTASGSGGFPPDIGHAIFIAAASCVRNQKGKLMTESRETEVRPRGSFTILEDCKVKRLVVKPGQLLSLQLHHRRAEHWIVTQGVAKVRIGDEELILEPNQSTHIPVETLHRLENPGTEDVHIIEVQLGDYFGEDDIERFEDVYGRLE